MPPSLFGGGFRPSLSGLASAGAAVHAGCLRCSWQKFPGVLAGVLASLSPSSASALGPRAPPPLAPFVGRHRAAGGRPGGRSGPPPRWMPLLLLLLPPGNQPASRCHHILCRPTCPTDISGSGNVANGDVGDGVGTVEPLSRRRAGGDGGAAAAEEEDGRWIPAAASRGAEAGRRRRQSGEPDGDADAMTGEGGSAGVPALALVRTHKESETQRGTRARESVWRRRR